MRYIFFIVFLFSHTFIIGQKSIAAIDTIFNQTDKQGFKQGFWKVKYPSGSIKYTAFYKDNKPVGLMKRYFDDNSLMAEMFFYKENNTVRAKLYFQGGVLAAEGKYSGKEIKDSTWNYYSFYTKTLSNRETYLDGKKNGISYSYFSSGKVSEERCWKNGVFHGDWHQYFENGILKFSSAFIEGKRDGAFLLNYPDNKPEWKGNYKNDKREGKWVHYDVEGKIDKVITYNEGVASNAEQLQAEEQKLLDDIENQKGKIPEPDETNFIPGAR